MNDHQTADGSTLWATVPRMLAATRYLVLATADSDGVPWATPVYFVARDESTLYWVSSPESRHSRNIAARPTVAITVFDSQVAVGAAEAVYLEATAQALGDGPALLDLLNSRLPPEKALSAEDLSPQGRLQVYRAQVSRHFVLIRGGDARFDNDVDERLEVIPPAP